MKVSAFVLACVSLLAFAPSSRADFAEDFSTLRAELERRRDEDLVGELDKTGKRQLAAVTKALAALDKGAADLGAEAKVAKKVLKTLAKAFPLEFAPEGAGLEIEALPVSLDDAFADLFTTLQEQVQALIAELEYDASGLSADDLARIQALLDQARATLAQIDPEDLPDWAITLIRVVKAYTKAKKFADRELDGLGTVVFTVNGVVFDAPVRTFSYSGPSGYNVTARGGVLYNEGAFSLGIQTGNTSFTPGERPLTNATFVDGFGPEHTYYLVSGSLTIVAISEEENRISGVFTLTVSPLMPADDPSDDKLIEGAFEFPINSPVKAK